MTDIYYSSGGMVVRRSNLGDVNHLATRLRQSDIDEMWASNHMRPYAALYYGLTKSVLCLTVEHLGEPVCVFGINAENLAGDEAVVWFLSSERLDKIQAKFLKNSRRFVEIMLGFYPKLVNWVDARNTKSIEWLEFCGAQIEEAIPYGLDGLNFRRFTFEKESTVSAHR